MGWERAGGVSPHPHPHYGVYAGRSRTFVEWGESTREKFNLDIKGNRARVAKTGSINKDIAFGVVF